MTAPTDRKTNRLIAARAIRSIAQGALVVDFTLYLRALAWPALWIGVLFAVGMALNIVLTLALGPLSDRLGRKRFLLAYEATQMAAAAIALATSGPLWLGLAAVIGSYGRGANGATGPFSPIEQSWLASGLPATGIAHAFRRNVSAGFFGMAAGSVIAIGPGAMRSWLPGALAYRPIFALAGLSAAACFVLLWHVPDRRQRRRQIRRLTQPSGAATSAGD